MIIPSFTITPASPTIPIKLAIVIFNPRTKCPTKTPKIDKGIVESIINDLSIESNIQTRAIKISIIAIKAASPISFCTFLFSFCSPFISIVTLDLYFSKIGFNFSKTSAEVIFPLIEPVTDTIRSPFSLKI